MFPGMSWGDREVGKGYQQCLRHRSVLSATPVRSYFWQLIIHGRYMGWYLSGQVRVYSVDCCLIVYQIHKLWTQVCRKSISENVVFKNGRNSLKVLFFPIEKFYWFLQDTPLVRKLRASSLRPWWFSTLVKFSVRYFLNVTCYRALPLVYCAQLKIHGTQELMCILDWKMNWC